MARETARGVFNNYLSLGLNGLGARLHGADVVSVVARVRWDTWHASGVQGDDILGVFSEVAAAVRTMCSALVGTVGADRVLQGGGRSAFADGFQICNGSTPLSLSQWYAVGVEWDYAAGEMRVYLDGSLDGTSAPTWSSTTYVHSAVTGTYVDSLMQNFASGSSLRALDGSLSEVAVYRVALGVAGHTAYARGASPLRIATPLDYYPILGRSSPEPDLCGGPSAAIVGAAPQITHPPGVGYPAIGAAA